MSVSVQSTQARVELLPGQTPARAGECRAARKTAYCSDGSTQITFGRTFQALANASDADVLQQLYPNLPSAVNNRDVQAALRRCRGAAAFFPDLPSMPIPPSATPASTRVPGALPVPPTPLSRTSISDAQLIASLPSELRQAVIASLEAVAKTAIDAIAPTAEQKATARREALLHAAKKHQKEQADRAANLRANS